MAFREIFLIIMKKQHVSGGNIRFGNRVIHIPGSKFQRTVLGILLCLGGIFSFLPVLGIWMLPLGILILSAEYHVVRRFRRRVEVTVGRWYYTRKALTLWRRWRHRRKMRRQMREKRKTPPQSD